MRTFPMTEHRGRPMLRPMRVVGPPSRERVTAIALRILEDALAQAHAGPVKRTMGHRLALAWLAHAGVGLPWHYETFWTAMADPHAHADIEQYRQYMRTRDLTSLLGHWYMSLGWEEPCIVQRGKWAMAYTGEKEPDGSVTP